MAASNEAFTPVDVSLAIGAGEPQVSKALLGLAAEGYLEKVETGKYKAAGMAELGQAEFLKAFARASRVDSTRQRDLAEIARLKQNNDTMRQRLLTTIAERDHYLAALKQRGIDPGPAPVPAATPPAAEPPRRRVADALAAAVGRTRSRASGSRGAVARVGGCAVGPGRHGRARQRVGRAELPGLSQRRALVRVTLIRHAEAGDDAPRDESRALTVHGRADARRLGRALARRGVRFSLMVTSPLVRAVQTAEIVAAATGYRGRMPANDVLEPEAAAADVVALLATAGRREVGRAGRP